VYHVFGRKCCVYSRIPISIFAHSRSMASYIIFSPSLSSEWNALNQYTGWCDVNLTRRGEGEARAAGRLLAENGIDIDHAFTSVLKRASYTTNMCLNMAGQQLR
jgi:hypothetical protein